MYKLLYVVGGEEAQIRRLRRELRGTFSEIAVMDDEDALQRALLLLSPLDGPVDGSPPDWEGWRFAAARRPLPGDRWLVVVVATRGPDPGELLARVAWL